MPMQRTTNPGGRIVGCVMQERQRQGIVGVHVDSLDEHLDRPEVQRLLGEVLHRSRPFLDSPPPELQVLTTVIMSR